MDMFFDMVLTEHLKIYQSSFSVKWDYDNPVHNYCHLDLITKGCLVIKADGETYRAEKNQILFIPAGLKYYQRVETVPYAYHSFLFSCPEGQSGEKAPVIFTPKRTDFYLEKYREAHHLYITKPPAYKLKIRKIIYDVLDKICEETFYKQNAPEGYYTIKESVEYINEHFSAPDISASIIAGKSHITPTYFRHLFKKIYSVTPNKYINTLRTNKAKSLLENTDYTTDEIAYRCGYSDYSYFSKVFSKYTAMSPGEYRKKYKMFK